MDLKKVSGFENMLPQAPVGIKKDPAGGSAFKDALKSFDSGSLHGALQNLSGQPAAIPTLKFSNHAVERMQSRGVYFSQDEIGKIQDAVGRAAAKGSKDSLILTDKAALIVSVKNNTVVTVMDKNALKENVFTNIDSTIVM